MGLALVISGCERKNSETTSAVPAPASKIAETPKPAVCGVAPSGDLIAERIVSANPASSEPGLYEGPVWIGDALYFSDFTFGPGFPSRIQKLDSAGVMTTAIADSGSNGLAVDSQGNIIAATHKYKALSRYKLVSGERAPFVEQYKGNVFNSPNDVAVAKDGTVYFTDPAFQKSAAPGGQEKTGIYRASIDGVVTLLDDSIKNPNGITLSPSGDVLYANGGEEQGILRAYPIVDGEPQAGKDLVTGLAVPDGMVVDCHGNLYVTEHTAQRVRVFTPAGEQIATIKVDANVTNAAFGGASGTTLFLTGAGSIWKLELAVSGAAF
ncbi:MAG: SMP-30/gluconolactonase/LRE family protein [Moraxellaceae bacterium]|nr:MAG: SMP-30/gluconolactonase/LRE family protein [Moraxellaceae bacterium]